MDTHIFVWWNRAETQRMGPRVVAAIEAAETLAVSGPTFYEIAQLVRRKRIELSTGWASGEAARFTAAGGIILEADHAIMERAGALDWENGDPFDRLILAIAIAHDIPILSRDARMAAFHDRVIG